MLTQRELANAIRILSIDAIQKANSGHPGMPLGMADIATVLWREFLQHNPVNPHWMNRDRFILSNGHGSMLHYSLLHLSGYDLSIADLKCFRQLHSKTPGHPEFGITPGIETTTGPLGQGLANAVGMALAEQVLAAQFNRPNFQVINNYTYVFAGDGCLMEGISHEACAFAGTHGLGKLIVFWDNNGISIDGHVTGWFTDDTALRFKAYGWHVVSDVDGHDSEAVKAAILEARAVNDRPSLICCRTIIGFGAPNMCGTHDCHGSPLGDKEIQATRANLAWAHPAFTIPEAIYQAWDARPQGAQLEIAWNELFKAYAIAYPDLAAELMRRVQRKLPNNWGTPTAAYLEKIAQNPETIATRLASQKCLNVYGPLLPELLGGSADLTASNLTNWSGSKDITRTNIDGNYFHYGVREFGMLAMMNGMALYGGFIPYGGTFLAFASYCHSAVRMAAMMRQRVIFIFSHDSIGLGEDGPTHQPIEQLTMLRVTPNVIVWRPCDVYETAVAWQSAITCTDGPTCLILSRQKMPAMQRSQQVQANVKCGGYILLDCDGTPDVIIIATGSEVALAQAAAIKLQQEGKKIRVVAMPAAEVFLKQSQEYQEQVLPKRITRRIAIEAGGTNYWYKFVGLQGKIIGIDRYGESAPEKELFTFFGITEDNIINCVKALL
jgi:transketolase